VHDADYRTSWKDWESFVESLTEKIIEKDDTIPELPPKDLVRQSNNTVECLALIKCQVFRVYRDIRFSPDPTPYKVSDLIPFCVLLLMLTNNSHTSLLHGICSCFQSLHTIPGNARVSDYGLWTGLGPVEKGRTQVTICR
jgi:Conserved hypothetical protein (DUF2461)